MASGICQPAEDPHAQELHRTLSFARGTGLRAIKVAQLHRSHVKRLLVDKHELGLSKDTIRLIRATISAIYAAAIDDGVALINPATLPRRAKALGRPPKSDIRPLSELELGAFLMTAQKVDSAYYAFFLLLARGS